MAATTTTFYRKPASVSVTVPTAGARFAWAMYVAGDMNGTEAKLRAYDNAMSTSYLKMFQTFANNEILTAIAAAEGGGTADCTLVASTAAA
jgi:hypothetical protein